MSRHIPPCALGASRSLIRNNVEKCRIAGAIGQERDQHHGWTLLLRREPSRLRETRKSQPQHNPLRSIPTFAYLALTFLAFRKRQDFRAEGSEGVDPNAGRELEAVILVEAQIDGFS